MCEVGLGSDEEAEEGVKPTIHRPELLAGCEGQGEGVDGDDNVDGDDDVDGDEDVDGDDDEDGDRMCVNPCFIKQKPALLQSH